MLTYKNLRKTLLESLVNPKIDSPIKVVIESENADYFEQRAIEMIKIARSIIQASNIDVHKDQVAEYNQYISDAITLLALAKLVRRII